MPRKQIHFWLFLSVNLFTLNFTAYALTQRQAQCLRGEATYLITQGWPGTKDQHLGSCYAHQAVGQLSHAQYRQRGEVTDYSVEATLLAMVLSPGNNLHNRYATALQRSRGMRGQTSAAASIEGGDPLRVLDFSLHSNRMWREADVDRKQLIAETDALARLSAQGIMSPHGRALLRRPTSLRDGKSFALLQLKDSLPYLVGTAMGAEVDRKKKESFLRNLLCRGVPVGMSGPYRKMKLMGRDLRPQSELNHPGLNPRSAEFIQRAMRIKELWTNDFNFSWHAMVAMGIVKDAKGEDWIIFRASHGEELSIARGDKINFAAYGRARLKDIGAFSIFEAVLTERDQEDFAREGFDYPSQLPKHQRWIYGDE